MDSVDLGPASTVIAETETARLERPKAVVHAALPAAAEDIPVAAVPLEAVARFSEFDFFP